MITKRIYQRMLMAAAAVVIGLGMASCVDNIDNGTKQNEKEQQAEEERQAKAEKYWAIVSQLVDVDDYTVDYEDKTFEPTYGLVIGKETGTRYVYTNDLAAAAARFADLVEVEGIDETTEKYTYDDPDVGTLVYTKGTGRYLATVDVDIEQIPSLKKIIYMPGAFSNGNFTHKSYYRFGDVVKRKQTNGIVGDDTYEYWVCVRPSFGLEGKGDSHWVSLSDLPDDNLKIITADGRDYCLPTCIGTDKEQMQNLAEMLYAIYHADKWSDHISKNQNSKLRMFHDFSKTRLAYHTQYFWENVLTGWNVLEISEKLFGLDQDAMWLLTADASEVINPSGLHLLYKGYSWLKTLSWNCTLYEAVFTSGTDETELNMHQAKYNNVVTNMQNIQVNCSKMGPDHLDAYGKFFPDNKYPRWAVRHATGKELASDHNYDPCLPILGVEEVYRYYSNIKPCTIDQIKKEKPETTFSEDLIRPRDVKQYQEEDSDEDDF